MGIDYYACKLCGEAFPDVIDYGHCCNCEETLCEGCRDEMVEKYGTLDESHEKYGWFGEDDPAKCDECNKPRLNKEKFEKLMYFMGKLAAQEDFGEFLEWAGITQEEYQGIKVYLQETYGIKLYI